MCDFIWNTKSKGIFVTSFTKENWNLSSGIAKVENLKTQKVFSCPTMHGSYSFEAISIWKLFAHFSKDKHHYLRTKKTLLTGIHRFHVMWGVDIVSM